MPTIKVQTYEHTCSRCRKVWGSKLEFPAACPRCHSPYWNKERVRKDYSEIYELAVGASVVVPWPEGYYLVKAHPAARIVNKLRQKGMTMSVTYHGDGAHITRLVPRPARVVPTSTPPTSTDVAGSTDVDDTDDTDDTPK